MMVTGYMATLLRLSLWFAGLMYIYFFSIVYDTYICILAAVYSRYLFMRIIKDLI